MSNAIFKYYTVASIHCRVNVFSVPLHSNEDDDIRSGRLTERIQEVRRWNDFRCHNMHTKFHENWLRHSKIDKRRFTDTDSINTTYG
jgi:hypothetical protein